MIIFELLEQWEIEDGEWCTVSIGLYKNYLDGYQDKLNMQQLDVAEEYEYNIRERELKE